MSRLIDAEGSELQTQLKIIREAEYQIYGSGSWGFTAKCEHAIENAPTVQPEIVRCKDCEHGVLDDGFPHQYFCVFKGDEWNNADYFCGHAKRREVTT